MSGFKRTLCGGAWLSLTGIDNAFDDLGGSKAKYGCCNPYNFMSTPSTTSITFVQSQCSSCDSGGPTVLNDDIDYYIIPMQGTPSKPTANMCRECTTCGTGKRQTTACSSASNRVCTQNVCSCDNGVKAEGTACTTHGANICTSCSSEYYKTGNTCTACTSCESGQYKTGTTCTGSTTDDTQSCAACLNGGSSYSCPSGKYVTGNACAGSGDTDTQTCAPCTSCVSGQYKTGTTCTGSTTDDTQGCATCANGGSSYSCPSGKYVTGKACPGSGNTDTQTCNDCVTGKYQNQNGSSKTSCNTCSFGQSAASASVACSGCASGQSQEKGKPLF